MLVCIHRQFTNNLYNESHLFFSQFQTVTKFYVLFHSQTKTHISSLQLTTLATSIIKLQYPVY